MTNGSRVDAPQLTDLKGIHLTLDGSGVFPIDGLTTVDNEPNVAFKNGA